MSTADIWENGKERTDGRQHAKMQKENWQPDREIQDAGRIKGAFKGGEKGSQNDVKQELEAGCGASPRVDVIIPAFRPGDKLEQLLKRLLKQTYRVNRIIIMNTESQYWNEERFEPLFYGSKTDMTLIHLSQEEFDHGGTRHKGILASDAEICICMTQDAIPYNRDLVKNLVSALTMRDDIAVSYARQLPAEDCRVIERYTRDFNYPAVSRIKGKEDIAELGIKTYFCSNVCAAYKRDIYLKLGGFIQKTIFNEDMIYAAKAVKAGYKIAYAADAQVIHSHNYSASQQLCRNFDLAVSQADHPEIFSGLASEGEGMRLVKTTAMWLLRNGKWYLIPELVIQSGFKYMGYRLGKAYKKLPGCLIRKLTMNRSYWEK